MLRINRMFTILLLVALLLSACQPIQLVATATQGQPHQPRPDAPPYAVRGSYPVGVRDFVINTPDRPIAVSVWYPALNPAAKPEAVTYTLDFPTNDFPAFTVAGRALRDAEPDYANGPYPLLLHIHAAWSTRQEMAYWVEHLASYGFVVIAPAMTDNWGMLFASVYQSEIARPQDASRTLDFAEELTAADGQLAGLIDPDHIAASGWSWGGQVALELAGARIDLNDWLATYCQTYPEDGDCIAYPEHLADMATLAGLAAPPDGLWPDWRDPRVDAIVPFAPGVSMFTDAGIQHVQIPVLLLLGSADDSVGSMFAMRQTYEKLPSPAKTRVLIENASHLVYFNSCAASPELIAAAYTWVCSDPVWDMDRAHDLINHFATAFLLAELKGDTEAAKALAPENVAFPGITYETTEFGKTGTEATASLDETTTAQIEAILTDTMQAVKVPGYAMCVVKDGQVVYNKGFGVTQLGGDQPVTPQSVFAIYSTTKSFTAVALMQLVEQGKVDLDAPVTTYLPYFTMADPAYQQITVRMLASHTSGLIDDEIFANLPKDEEPADIGAAIEWFVRALADDKLTAAPPTVWQYAGTNFILLGDIIGKVSGEPYDVYITKHLLEPLGMTHSTLNPATIPADTLVGEHITADGVVTETQPSDFSGFETPEAGMHSTCEDMTRWMQVHLNHGELEGVRILLSESYDILWKREASTGMDEFFGAWIGGYGLGWTVAEDRGHFLAGHPGGGAGQTSGYQLAPSDNLAVTVLANWGMDDAFPAWTAAVDVLYHLLGLASQGAD